MGEGDTKLMETLAAPTSASATPSAAPTHEVVGGRYEILGLLGVGGMGSVYKARDVELDEIVALKSILRELVETPGVIERFRREVKLARRVTHVNVARVFDIGEHQGNKFLTMEFIDGESLADLLAREGPLPVARVVAITTEVCAGLTAAHAAGVIHRDLKPDNVLITRDGRAVITDFGIARASLGGSSVQTVGSVVGTPAYMAPEQVEGSADIDARADIYALGAMLYELFTGERAWGGDAAFAVAAARLVRSPPDPRAKRPELPDACAKLTLRCMARSREDRYATAADVAADLAVLTLPAFPALQPTNIVSSSRISMKEVFEGAMAPDGNRGAGPFGGAEKSVAVLPFRNAGAAQDEDFADGITDDLIDTLSTTSGLKVRPRGVVWRWKGVDQDAREIGRELGVQVVVEGSLRRLPGRVRVTARLISVADGFQLWAKRFDRPEEDALVVSDEAARAIADALTVDIKAPARESLNDAAAVDLYLRARLAYRRFTLEGFQQAMTLFDEAITRAPDNPTILSGYAITLARLYFFTGQDGDLARAAAERAVAAAPELAEARLAQALTHFQAGEIEPAVRATRSALLRSPHLAEAQELAGRILVEIGHVDEGVRFLESAMAHDSQVFLAPRELARVHAFRGEWAQAHSLLEMGSTFGREGWVARARMALWQRDGDRMLECLNKSPMAPGPELLALGIDAAIRRFLDQVPGFMARESAQASPRRKAFTWQIAAELAGYLGEHERALDAVRQSTDGGLIDLFWLDGCPLLGGTRGLPGFAQVRERVVERAGRIAAAFSD